MFSPGRYLVIRDNIVIGIFDRLSDARKFAERIKRKPEILIIVDCLIVR